MEPMKIEWVGNALLHNDKTGLFEPDKYYTPVVRLAAVDAILAEAVVFTNFIRFFSDNPAMLNRAQAFLASLTVTDWEKRQKMKRDIPASFGDIQDKQEEHNG